MARVSGWDGATTSFAVSGVLVGWFISPSRIATNAVFSLQSVAPGRTNPLQAERNSNRWADLAEWLWIPSYREGTQYWSKILHRAQFWGGVRTGCSCELRSYWSDYTSLCFSAAHYWNKVFARFITLGKHRHDSAILFLSLAYVYSMTGSIVRIDGWVEFKWAKESTF